MDNDTYSHVSSFNLVTFNCFGVPFLANTRVRLYTMARELNQTSVDAVCLQEIQLSTYVPLLDRSFTQFPFLAFEPFIYAPKGGLLTLSRWPIKNTRFSLYPERGWWHTPSLADRLLHKGVLITEVTCARQRIVIMNTHLTANYNNNWSRSNRYARLEQAQLQQLATLVNEQTPDSIVIIAGDFNIPRRSWLYHEFVETTGVVDPMAEDQKPTQYLFRMLPSHFQQAIDHVFVRLPATHEVEATAELLFEEKIRLISGRLARLSDHMAIKLHLEWPLQENQG